MISKILNIMAFASFPAVAIILGGSLTLFRTPSDALKSKVQHFTAGVIFAALATELLPDVMHRRMPVVTVIGFTLGVAVMLGIKYFTEKLGQRGIGKTKEPMALIFAFGVDIVLDGILIGLGFAAGQKQGLLLTIALTLEVLFLGISAGTSLRNAQTSRKKIILFILCFAILLLIGAVIGAVLLSVASPALLDAILAFGIAALLYLVTEELLIEAHEVPETVFQAAMFFAGFIGILIIEMQM